MASGWCDVFAVCFEVLNLDLLSEFIYFFASASCPSDRISDFLYF